MNNHGRDQELEKIHNEYIKQVTESGLPLWIANMYNQPTLKPTQNEENQEDNRDDDTLDDPHMFI